MVSLIALIFQHRRSHDRTQSRNEHRRRAKDDSEDENSVESARLQRKIHHRRKDDRRNRKADSIEVEYQEVQVVVREERKEQTKPRTLQDEVKEVEKEVRIDN